jgi:voltage-gated potassium channel Kch
LIEKPLVLIAGRGRLAHAIREKLLARAVRVEHLPAAEEGLADVSRMLSGAAVLVLTADDDPGNVDLALTARRLHPGLPLVVRLFDQALVTYLRESLDNVTILSMSVVAAPVFAKATVAAIAKGPAASAALPRQRTARRPKLDRVMLAILGGLVAVVVPSTLYFQSALGLTPINALYFVVSTITTVGYGDIALRDASSVTKIVGMLLMFGGAAFMASLFALLTAWVVTRRLEVLSGRVRVRYRGHVVIAGGGNVGIRTAELLAGQGRKVVVIERDTESRTVPVLRAAGHHVIVEDATREGILELAGLERAAAVVALTDSDAVNLHISLLVRARRPGLPVVLRVVSPELSAHVSERGDVIGISPIAVAADEFAASALAVCERAREA